MSKNDIPICNECVTIPQERYKQLLEYEQIALWFFNLIVTNSLPSIELKEEKIKEIKNDAKCKAIQAAFQEALNGKE